MKTREENIQAWAKKCRHFNGIQNKKCEAGIDYDTISKKKDAFVCFGEVPGCDKFDARGLDEAKLFYQKCDNDIKNYAVARGAIVKATEGKRGVFGRIECPICKTGKLEFSIAEYNGHIHARCTTKDCVVWME